jgi:small subunit ribosomal protein S8
MSASSDTLGDFLTTLRNGSKAERATVTGQWSRIREGVARILKDSGYIKGYRRAEKDGLPVLEVELKYVAGTPAITGIERISTPGRRVYSGNSDIPKVIGGMGVTIVTTSKGILTDVDCRRQKVSGELLAKVW